MPSSSSLSLNIRTSSTGVLLGLTCRAEHDCVASAASAASVTGPATVDYPSTDHLDKYPYRAEDSHRESVHRQVRQPGEGERGRGRSTPLLLVGSQRTATQNGAWSGLLFPCPVPWCLVRTNAPYCTPDSDSDSNPEASPVGIHSCVSKLRRQQGPWPAQARKAWMVEDVWNGRFAHRVDPVGRESRRDAPKLVRCQSLPEQAIDAPAVGEAGSGGLKPEGGTRTLFQGTVGEV
ncbi:uncharacterized protein BDZ83DRAFT_195992 [Colletotrichum acutatum]|uniref:Uncharacterized protein n=1 Tax=Glomerella acutata TaxID=27357 RepID=A0AAD8XIE1_GLOAC|nr:uncharacterized protein BDZ83DRAFT_195992 [Colletotrichum acutatum]KAK1727576.1 hypothetical protein BDZ83DRAFT_195992 [Colletotrichum acutatum]